MGSQAYRGGGATVLPSPFGALSKGFHKNTQFSSIFAPPLFQILCTPLDEMIGYTFTYIDRCRCTYVDRQIKLNTYVVKVIQIDRQIEDREIDRQIVKKYIDVRKIDRQIGRQMDRQVDRQIDRQIYSYLRLVLHEPVEVEQDGCGEEEGGRQSAHVLRHRDVGPAGGGACLLR